MSQLTTSRTMMSMTTSIEMGIDVETFSGVDIKNGAYAYADAPDFEIMLIAYKLGDAPVRQFMPRRFADCPGVLSVSGVDGQTSLFGKPDLIKQLKKDADILDGDEDEFLEALNDPSVIKTAYNANFERTALRSYYGAECNPDEWRCTAVLASTLGLPRSLKDAGDALGLPEDEKKLKTGKALIQYFCKYVRPTASNGHRDRNYPIHDPEKWKLFCIYNKQDVVTEQAILDRLKRFRPIPKEQRLWSVDQNISDRGIRIDVPFVQGIVDYDKIRIEKCMEEAREITGLQNPNSVAQLKRWFAANGAPALSNDLSKAAVAEALSPGHESLYPTHVRRMLELRQALGKSSTKKYQTMLASVCKDGRVRGMLQFYGANRTGRWAGRIVQLQNLPQNHIPDLDLARQTVADKDFDILEMMYGEPAQVFSELVRTAFIPSDGCHFIVTDFSAIEARVIAWIAGEEWRLDTFRTGGDIYCASASQMFGVPVVKHGINGHLRQRGKVAELALGYGGGVGAMKSMDTTHTIPEEDMPDIVAKWRERSPRITRLWKCFERCAKTTIETGRPTVFNIQYEDKDRARGDENAMNASHGAFSNYFNRGIKIRFSVDKIDGKRFMFVTLPSGRAIAYPWPSLQEGNYGDEIEYWGTDTTHTWAPIRTYGGKLTENIVQATARDCLAEKMIKVEEMGYHVVAHVHDEMIIDVPRADKDAFQKIDDLMAEPIDWAPGLPLKGGTYACDYYQKD